MENKEIKEIIDDLKEDIEQDILIEVRGNVFKPLVDYITNLQEENENLKADYGSKSQVERDLLQQRIDKAIEEIEKYYIISKENREDLLDILRGKDKEE